MNFQLNLVLVCIHRLIYTLKPEAEATPLRYRKKTIDTSTPAPSLELQDLHSASRLKIAFTSRITVKLISLKFLPPRIK